MEADKVIEHMEKFDFSTEVQVKVIFDDSDDESTEEIKEIKQEIDLVTAKEIKEKKQETLGAEGTNIEEENHKHSEPSSSCNTAIKLEPEDTSELSNTDSVIYIHNDDEMLSNKIDKRPDTETQTHTMTSSNSNSSRKRKLDTISSNESGISEKKSVDLNNDHQDNTNISEPSAPANTSDDNSMKRSKTDVYLTKLLISLSEYLISILDGYFVYLTEQNKPKTTPNEKKKSKQQFQQIRSHYFNLSYSTVLNILVPQEQNSTFINCFLEATLKRVEKLNKPYLLDAHIRPLFIDLMVWTKKQNSCVFTSNPNNPGSQLISSPPNPNTNNINKAIAGSKSSSAFTDASMTNLNISCRPQKAHHEIFSTGPPGQQISITVSQTVMQARAAAQTLENSSNVSVNHINNLQQFTQANPNQQNRFYSQNIQKDSALRNLLNNLNAQHSAPNHSDSFYSRRLETNAVKPISTTMTANAGLPQTYQQSLEDHLNTVKSTNIPTYEQVIRNRRNTTKSSNKRSDPGSMHYQQVIEQQINSMLTNMRSDAGSTHTYQHISEQQLNTDTIRSVSTDSGFASPLHFSTGNETMDKECVERIVPRPTPVITHVTSMNPGAVSNVTGSCSVCGISTKQMCIGCYKRYYCSYPCQSADWQCHQYYCHT